MRDKHPLLARIMSSFDTGGLENAIINLINHMVADAYRHANVALTGITAPEKRINKPEVPFLALNKPPCNVLWIYPQHNRLFLQLQPAIVNARNVGDFLGTNKKCQWIRRIHSPFVKHYKGLFQDLACNLINHPVRIGTERVTQIYGGVEAAHFDPATQQQDTPGSPFNKAVLWLLGTATAWCPQPTRQPLQNTPKPLKSSMPVAIIQVGSTLNRDSA